MRLAIAFLLLLPLSACATAMTQGNLDNIRNRSLAIAVGEPATLQSQTGTKAVLLGPLFSGLGAASQGHGIVKDNNIADPAIGIAQGLSRELAQKYQMQPQNTDPVLNQTTATYADISRAANNADLVLLTQTALQSSIYYLTDMNNYKVTIIVWAHLIDATNGKTLVSGSCKYEPEYSDTDDAPSWDDLYANGAAGYKDEVRKAEEYCIPDLMQKVFTL